MRINILLISLIAVLTACAPTTLQGQIVPTERPTATNTATVTPSPTRASGDATPTATDTRPPATTTAGPSPTSLFGPTSTAAAARPSPTRVINPNAPRIEFFTSDTQAVAPGSDLTLYWSTRNVNGATIYRLDPGGARNQLWNVSPDGSLTVSTSRADRGAVDFVISVGESVQRVEQVLTIPLTCPVTWFFVPAPEACPSTEPVITQIVEQEFVRGRMVYVGELNQVYALLNDGFDPAWVGFDNRYNPEIHPESAENFPLRPGQVQPLRELGFVWRGNDIVRSRLGLGITQEATFDGFVQTVEGGEDRELFLSSADGTVLRLLPEGEAWQIITLP